MADTKKQKINPFYWKFFLVSTGLFIFWILFSQSFEYRFFKAKWDENLVTFDRKRQIQACGALLRLLTNLSMQKIFSMGGSRSEIGYRNPHESISSMGV